jgi:hypothetical protein
MAWQSDRRFRLPWSSVGRARSNQGSECSGLRIRCRGGQCRSGFLQILCTMLGDVNGQAGLQRLPRFVCSQKLLLQPSRSLKLLLRRLAAKNDATPGPVQSGESPRQTAEELRLLYRCLSLGVYSIPGIQAKPRKLAHFPMIAVTVIQLQPQGLPDAYPGVVQSIRPPMVKPLSTLFAKPNTLLASLIPPNILERVISFLVPSTMPTLFSGSCYMSPTEGRADPCVNPMPS